MYEIFILLFLLFFLCVLKKGGGRRGGKRGYDIYIFYLFFLTHAHAHTMTIAIIITSGERGSDHDNMHSLINKLSSITLTGHCFHAICI